MRIALRVDLFFRVWVFIGVECGLCVGCVWVELEVSEVFCLRLKVEGRIKLPNA